MVGGTIGWDSRRELIHREGFRGFGPPTPLTTSLCEKHCSGKVLLDNEFVLIEWHPRRWCADFEHSGVSFFDWTSFHDNLPG
jgi:hypothetical protein